jgi:ferric enterobactin receptor
MFRNPSRNCAIQIHFKIIAAIFIIFFNPFIYSQTISGKYIDVPLTVALSRISENYKIKFAYDNGLTDKITVNQTIANKTIEETLSTLLSGTGLNFIKTDEVFIIFPEKKDEITDQTLIQPDVPKKEPCCVSGIVRDMNTGEQLPFATVYIPGTNMGTTTNNNGFFNLITSLCDSTNIFVSYIGYEIQKIRALAQKHPSVITIFVDYKTEAIEEVEVRKKNDLIEAASSSDPLRIKLNTSLLADMVSLSELDVTAPIQLMPGIDGTTETSAGFNIRKSSADKNLILYDGFSIYQIDHLFGSFSSMNGKAIKDIQVYKDGYDARYGGRTSGLIEITGKSGNMYKPVIDIGADLLSADAKLELPLVKDKLSFIVAGRRAFSDKLQTPLFINLFNNVCYDFQQYYTNYPKAFSEGEGDPVYYFSDLHSKLTFKPRQNQVFSISYLAADDNLSFVQKRNYPTLNEKGLWGMVGYSFRYSGPISNRWQNDIIIGHSVTDNNYEHEDTTLRKYKVRIISLTDTISKYDIVKNSITDNSLALYS